MFVAFGGSVLTVYLLMQALRRNADEDAYMRRGSLMAHLRPSKSAPQAAATTDVPLRPAVARILAQRGETTGHKSASLRAGLTPVEPEGSRPPPKL